MQFWGLFGPPRARKFMSFTVIQTHSKLIKSWVGSGCNYIVFGLWIHFSGEVKWLTLLIYTIGSCLNWAGNKQLQWILMFQRVYWTSGFFIQTFFHKFLLKSRWSTLKVFSKLKNFFAKLKQVSQLHSKRQIFGGFKQNLQKFTIKTQ